jgi:molybdate transport system substrate-binding protein
LITRFLSRRFALTAAFGLALTIGLNGVTAAADVTVMISGAFTPVYNKVKEDFEKQTGYKLIYVSGPSMGATPQAIPNRLSRGETADVVIMARGALDSLVEKKLAVAGSQTDLVHSYIAMAVKQGAPRPDISTVEAVKKMLLNAKSVAYSDSSSGVYISTKMFKELGIDKEMASKAQKVEATPVGESVAEGKFEIGFQQLSELKPVHGIDIVGLLPEKIQLMTVFSAGISANSKSPEGGKALIAYLSSPKAYAATEASGLKPASKD